MRMKPVISATLLAACAAVAACGGSKAPVVAPGGGDTAPPSGGGRVMAPGTSGLPGLDFGADVKAIEALYADLTPVDVGLAYTGTVEGLPATITFTVGNTGLTEIAITWSDTFPSMGACGLNLEDVRAAVDARLGPSTEDNLAAYWETPTATVVLSCGMGDGEESMMAQSYAPRAAE